MENELNELYFKDAFSQSSNGINLNINNLTANCITSNNDNFSLDSDGNLIVKTIQATDSIINIDYPSILNIVYPVGSIYISILGTNPSTIFGGIWEAFATGKTLVGIDNAQTEFDTVEKTGGSKDLQQHSHYVSATLSGGTHTHSGRYRSMAAGNLYCLRRISDQDSYEGDASQITYPGGEHSHTLSTDTNNTGSGNSGNLSPFIVVYMWKRIG